MSKFIDLESDLFTRWRGMSPPAGSFYTDGIIGELDVGTPQIIWIDFHHPSSRRHADETMYNLLVPDWETICSRPLLKMDE